MGGRTSPGGGIGCIGLLTIALVGLKLTGHVGWSWWWVLSPLWISTAVVGGLALGALVLVGLLAKR